ncbi:MAG: hypothetical protein ACI39U_01640 [Candidatus Cryptobacteroides sp.]
MKKVILLICILYGNAAMLLSAPKSEAGITVCSWDITSSLVRANDAARQKCAAERLWSRSVDAVIGQFAEMDCDVVGLQDVCDSIAGRLGDKGILRILNEAGMDYEGVFPSNLNPNFPEEGRLSSGTGILWKASKFECLDWGISWLSGIYDKPGRRKGLKYGVANRSFTWVCLKEMATGREFYVASANFNGPTYYDSEGKKVIYNEINVENANNLITYLSRDIVPEGMSSIIMVNARCSDTSEGYSVLSSSKWMDVFDQMRDETTLDVQESKCKDTLNSPDEKQVMGGRPDHILLRGASPLAYSVERKKFRTADGSLHYPAYHFPVVAKIKFTK